MGKNSLAFYPGPVLPPGTDGSPLSHEKVPKANFFNEISPRLKNRPRVVPTARSRRRAKRSAKIVLEKVVRLGLVSIGLN